MRIKYVSSDSYLTAARDPFTMEPMARSRTTKDVGKDLPARIDRLVKAGLTLEAIADQSGCSMATLYRWRGGKARPYRSLLRAFETLEAKTLRK
jgi:hypothetical protein